ESLASARLLLLVNYRPEYRHDWGTKTYYTQVRLDPLEKEDAQELIDALLGLDPALAQLKQFILTKTEGNPFFLEEIVQALREQRVLAHAPVGGAQLRPDLSTGHSPVSPGRASPAPTDLHLPPTVQAVLASRIDRLPAEEKGLLQTLAVIGKEFSYGLVQQVAGHPEDTVQSSLSHLQSAEFIYEQPAFPDSKYTFKHALTQEVAYNSLLQDRRKAVHERTAQAIEALYHAQLEDHYSELAYHYSRSGNTQKAVEYLHHAGQQAAQQAVYTEAITNLTAALELLKTLPDTPGRVQQELTLQLTLGVPLQIIKGHAAPEVGKTYSRVLELCGQAEGTPQLFPALLGLWRFYFLRPEGQKARELAEQMMHLAQSSQDPALLLEAHRVLGATLHWLGELMPGRRHLEQGIVLYDIPQHRSHAFLYGIDPGVYCLTFGAWNLWCLGYPDQALTNMRDALRLAHELAHPFTVAFALSLTVLVPQFRGEAAAVREQAEALFTLATEHGFAFRAAAATVMQGWVLAAEGHMGEGITRTQEGLTASLAMGSEAIHPYYFALLAETYGTMGQPKEGLATLTEALAMMQRTGERWYEAELYRLKGTLTLQSKTSPEPVSGKSQASQNKSKDTSPQHPTPSTQAEAEACFLKAIEIARRQQAKSLELRAVMSLARLWRQQGKIAEARQRLTEIYGWFTEGFDTKDLQEAKALLEEL
ncbi:MAG: hypothetical protein HY268_02465, partial [Deltaproteobacteria bacterium]|nr:hypothetical protein [Deltaproteobacteria bacterium]